MNKALACLLLIAGCNSSSSTARTPDELVSQPVVWTGLVNAAASGGTLTKNGGQPDLDDSSGVSQQVIGADGWLEFTVQETDSFRFAGLSHTPGGSAAIDVAVRLQAGRGDIYENGAWAGDNTVVAGGGMRLSGSAGQITGLKNGAQ